MIRIDAGRDRRGTETALRWETVVHQVALAGRVLDAETKRGIPDAAVRVRGIKNSVNSETRTARDGHYHFLDLPNGNYIVSASLPGRGTRYAAAEQRVTVSRDKESNLEMKIADLMARPTMIQGRITNSDGEAIALAEVRVRGSGESTFSRADGGYRLTGIETSRTKRGVVATAPGYENSSKDVSLTEPGKVQEQDFKLKRTGTKS
jgi:hypothetical protein